MATFATLLRFLLIGSMNVAVAAGHAADLGAASNTEAIRHKLDRIIIPKMDFRDATAREAVEFLKKKSVELDTESPAGERGVDIVFKLDGGNEKDTGDDASQARITVSLTNIPLIEALKYVTGLSNLKFQVDSQAVSIVRPNLAAGTLITKEWKIPRDLIPGADKLKSRIDREIGKSWLIANGVTFDGAATAVYIVKSSRLIVRNTQDQVDLVNTIVPIGQGGGPVPMEIECRLVEVQQKVVGAQRKETRVLNIDAFSKQFSATEGENHTLIGAASGSDVVVTREASPILAGSISGGARSIGPDVIDEHSAPGAMPLSGVFTDPQFQMILRILKEQKRADFVSMPKVTVKSGQPVVIEFIRQYDDLREEVPPQVRKLAPAAVAESPVTFALPPFTRRDRNISVAVEVLPVVGPDGYTIDLSVSSQIREFEGFAGYGGPFLWTNPSLVGMRGIVTPHAGPHLLYQTPKVKSTVSIYDGQTVFFNDLLSEAVGKEMADKDLLLTKIPVLGRLEGAGDGRAAPRRLMLFLSTRLQTPRGEPVRAVDEKEEVIGTDAPPEKPPVNSK